MILADYIAARLATPFIWGQHDCVLFTVRWAEIQTGRELLPKKIWATELAAQRLLKKNGGLINVFEQNFQRIQPNFACDGDIAVADDIAYLYSGAHIVGTGMAGLVFRPRSEAQHAFKV